MAKDGVFAIQIFQVVRESNEKLRATSSFLTLGGWGYGHRNRSTCCVFEMGQDGWNEVARDRL